MSQEVSELTFSIWSLVFMVVIMIVTKSWTKIHYLWLSLSLSRLVWFISLVIFLRLKWVSSSCWLLKDFTRLTYCWLWSSIDAGFSFTFCLNMQFFLWTIISQRQSCSSLRCLINGFLFFLWYYFEIWCFYLSLFWIILI